MPITILHAGDPRRCRSPSRASGSSEVAARSPRRPAVVAERAGDASTTAEIANVTPFAIMSALGAAEQEHRRGDRRAGGEAEVGDRAVERHRGRQPPRLDEARERGERGRREQRRCPKPASSASATRRLDAVDEADADERARARRTSATTMQRRRDQRSAAAPNSGPEQHRRQEVGEQDERDGPRRVRSGRRRPAGARRSRRPCRARTARAPRRSSAHAARAAKRSIDSRNQPAPALDDGTGDPEEQTAP